jgi:hypothetical protein
MSTFRKLAVMCWDRGDTYHVALDKVWRDNKIMFDNPSHRFKYATIRALVRMVYGR